MKKIFKVVAEVTVSPYITQGKIYEVYSVTFPKLNPEGLFYVYTDSCGFQRLTSSYFKPCENNI